MGEDNGAYLHRFLGGEKHQGTDPAFQDQLGKDLEPRTCGEEENASLGIPTPYAPEKQGRSFLMAPTPFWVLEFKSHFLSFGGQTGSWESGVNTGQSGDTLPWFLLSPLWAEPTKHLSKHGVVFSSFAKSACQEPRAA